MLRVGLNIGLFSDLLLLGFLSLARMHYLHKTLDVFVLQNLFNILYFPRVLPKGMW